MCSLLSSTVHSERCAAVPVKLYKTAGQRWMYTCVNYMAVIAVWSLLESLLALEHLIRAYAEACLISRMYIHFTVSFRACLMSAWQHNGWELQLRDAWSATTQVSVWNTQVFRTALTALTEPGTLWQRITRFPSPRWRAGLHTHLYYYAPSIHTIRTSRVLHSSQGLQLCWCHSHQAWRCLCLSSPDSHILPLRYCYISDAALTPSLFSLEILSHIAIQSSLRIRRLPLHLVRHYRILQVWNIQSNLHPL
jgi:hypothetical protein